jgi:hypothetical protein
MPHDAAQTHFISRSLIAIPNVENVHALLATNPKKQAIIFVHGFMGDYLKTWSSFELLLPERNSCSGQDIFFYGYNASTSTINGGASVFRVFLSNLMTNTARILNESLPAKGQRGQDFRYDKVLLVSHSLGAVIVRRAMVDATNSNVEWVGKTSQLHFAPAHLGARVTKLALEAVSGFKFLRFFAGLVQYASPLVDELEENSPPIQALITDTELALRGGNRHLTARRVVWAEEEKIVPNRKFPGDPDAEVILGTTHTTVCKPSTTFNAPIEHLEKCL